MKIVVLAGGLSSERDVSLVSGSLIANELIEAGHKVILIDLYEGIDIKENELEDLFLDVNNSERYQHEIGLEAPDLQKIKDENNGRESLIGNNVIEICKFADIVFNALHGSVGENGKLQAVFDILGIKYTGTGYLGSTLAMNKDLTKRLLSQAQIPTAPWTLFRKDIDDLYELNGKVKFPCVVKPCNNGSSVGVYMVENIIELKNAIKEIGSYDSDIIIEEKIEGREFSVGILDSKALPIIEIIPQSNFFDYKNKYQKDGATEICPANLSSEQEKAIQNYALKVHDILRLGVYSRIDFILNNKGEFMCLEANTLPGMTPTSLMPQEASKAGINYRALCEKVIFLSLRND